MTEPEPNLIIRIMRATAEVYGVPVALCRATACRRARACCYRDLSRDPRCLANVGDREMLLSIMRTADAILNKNRHATPAETSELREIEEIAIAICKQVAKSDDIAKDAVEQFLRFYRARQMTDAEFRAFQAEAAAELAAAKRSMARWEN